MIELENCQKRIKVNGGKCRFNSAEPVVLSLIENIINDFVTITDIKK